MSPVTRPPQFFYRASGDGSVREIPEQDLELLRTMGRGQLPEKLVETYWQYKWHRDTLDASPLVSYEFAFIAMLAGLKAPPTVEKSATVLDQIKAGACKEGDTITVLFRNKKQPAEFFGLTPEGTVMARLADDPQPRAFDPDKVLAIGA
jgi:hypothetical protein